MRRAATHRNVAHHLLVVLAALSGYAGARAPASAEVARSGAAGERCTIGGTAHALLVEVPGVATAGVRASGVPAELSFALEPGLEHVPAHVLSPIDFRGETHLGATRLVTAVPVVRGPITVHAGAPLGHTTIADGSLRAVLSVGATPSQPGYVQITLELSCAEVALGAEGTPPPDVRDPPSPTHVLEGSQDLALSLEPGGPTALTLGVAETTSGPLQVRVIEERDGWAHVESRLYWAEIDGWVPRERLRAEPAGEWRLEASLDFGPLSACGRSDHPYSYRGPAVVRAGATVHEEASRVVWGRFAADTEVEIGVRRDGGNGFAEVLRAPGIDTPECSSLEFDHAMVPLESVVLP